MKPLASLAVVAVLSACSPLTQSAVETPLPPSQALDVASVPAADATCSHGTVSDSRRFVLCENGALRKAGVVDALDEPARTDLSIEEVAQRYAVASQVFTGIEVATYGNILPKDRRPVRNVPRSKAGTRETVTIEGKIYDIYYVGNGEKTGAIFVERKAAQ